MELLSNLVKCAKRVEHKTVIHGREIIDHYSWLRNKDTDRDVLKYINLESEYTQKQLIEPTQALQNEFYNEFLSRIKETDESVPYRSGNYMYYHITEKGLEYPIYCRKPILNPNERSIAANSEFQLGEREVLLDLNTLAKEQNLSFLSLGNILVSPNHSTLAYALDTEGDEVYTLYFKDLHSGKLLNDVIEEMTGDFVWANDNKTIFYTIMDSAMRAYKIYRHIVNFEIKQQEEEEEEEEDEEEQEEEQEEEEEEERDEVDRGSDICIFTENDERFNLGLEKTNSGRFLLFLSESHTTTEIRYLEADNPNGTFKMLLPKQQDIEYDVDHHGGYFYVVEDAKRKTNYRLLRIPISNPSLQNAEQVLSFDENCIIQSILCFKTFIVLHAREDGLPKLIILDPDTLLKRYISFPDPSYSLDDEELDEFDSPFVRLCYSTFVKPPTIYDYYVQCGELLEVRQFDIFNYDPTQYQMERIYATSSVDSTTKLPISLAYRKTGRNMFQKDGRSPCLLYGYGSYSCSCDPEFDSAIISLLDRGFVVAIAHIRGGGEFGKRWHNEGKLMNKKNTFTDFIDCSQYLIENGYTSSDRLAIRGASAGGLLIANVVNSRPDLFAAAINEVGFVDVTNSMLDTSLPLTTGEFEEFGNPSENKEMFDYIQSYSPYNNVLSQANIGTRYPSIFITISLNDTRVGYFENLKYIAMMRWYFANMHQHGPLGSKLYLKSNMGEGHSGKSGRYEVLKDEALVYAFLVSHLPSIDDPISPKIK
jgi:oligopeptidase B